VTTFLTSEVQHWDGLGAADDAGVRAAAFRADLAIRRRGLGGTAGHFDERLFHTSAYIV
jgi:hypothetical protein